MKPTEKQIQNALKTLDKAGYFAIAYHSLNEIQETFESHFEEEIMDGELCIMTDQDLENVKALIVKRFDKGYDISFDVMLDIISEYANKHLKVGTFDNSAV